MVEGSGTASAKTVPSPDNHRHRIAVVPYRVLPLSIKAASGELAVAAVERGEQGGAATAHGDAEDRAIAIRTAFRRAVQGAAVGAERQPGNGLFRCCR